MEKLERKLEDFEKNLPRSKYEEENKKRPKLRITYRNKNYQPRKHPSHIDPLTGALVFRVNSWELPPFVVGLYHIPSNTEFIDKEQSSMEQLKTYYHEQAHAMGILNETEAENYAELRIKQKSFYLN